MEQPHNLSAIHVYGCGSPIRLPLMRDLASGIGSSVFHEEANPVYYGGASVVWGLIRGAKELMHETSVLGGDFWQVDHGYFGREKYFRITKNGLQLLEDLPFTDWSRFNSVKNSLRLSIQDYKIKRGDYILICLSSPLLYKFYDLEITKYLESLLGEIRSHSDRPIRVRPKKTHGIDQEILGAHIVVSHTSAATIDALRLGIPIVTTGICAATKFSTSIEKIECPAFKDGREKFFHDLCWRQFSPGEFKNGFAWSCVEQSKGLNLIMSPHIRG